MCIGGEVDNKQINIKIVDKSKKEREPSAGGRVLSDRWSEKAMLRSHLS